MVKELRDMSGAGMMDAKNALSENGGDNSLRGCVFDIFSSPLRKF